MVGDFTILRSDLDFPPPFFMRIEDVPLATELSFGGGEGGGAPREWGLILIVFLILGITNHLIDG